jgi:hypothetical protein
MPFHVTICLSFSHITHRPISFLLRSPPSLGAFQTRLDVALLEQHVQQYLQSALSKSTMRSYTTSLNQYTSFCSSPGYEPFPMSEQILCQFVSYLAQLQLKHQTIKCYLSGIRIYQILRSQPDPFIKNMPKLLRAARN